MRAEPKTSWPRLSVQKRRCSRGAVSRARCASTQRGGYNLTSRKRCIEPKSSPRARSKINSLGLGELCGFCVSPFPLNRLFLDCDFAHHSKISMSDFHVGGLRIRDQRHLTMQNVSSGSKVLTHPDYSLQIVAIEYAAHCIGRCRTACVVFPPTPHVFQRLALVQSKNVHFMHRWPDILNPNDLRPFA